MTQGRLNTSSPCGASSISPLKVLAGEMQALVQLFVPARAIGNVIDDAVVGNKLARTALAGAAGVIPYWVTMRSGICIGELYIIWQQVTRVPAPIGSNPFLNIL